MAIYTNICYLHHDMIIVINVHLHWLLFHKTIIMLWVVCVLTYAHFFICKTIYVRIFGLQNIIDWACQRSIYFNELWRVLHIFWHENWLMESAASLLCPYEYRVRLATFHMDNQLVYIYINKKYAHKTVILNFFSRFNALFSGS